MIPATILCFFFLINAGLSTYYKERFGQVASEGLSYSSTYLGSADVNLDTQVFIGELFNKMNVPASNINCKVEKTTINGVDALMCTTKSDFDLIKGSPLPYKISLTEVSCTTKFSPAQVAVRALVNGGMRTIYIPTQKRLSGLPTVYNPRLIMSNQGVDSCVYGAPDL